MNFKRMGVATAGVILLAASTIFGQDAGRRLDGTANRLDRSPVGATAGGLTAGRVTLSNATGQVTDDAGLTYNRTTDTLTVANGAVVASNVTASGLATPGSITVTPTLTEEASITTVAAGWRATGLLTAAAAEDMSDGGTFVLSDGTHVPQSFEFDLAADGVVGGHVEIDIVGTEDAIAVGALCAAAINATTGAGFTYEAIDNLDGTVTLRNTTWAAAGNTAQSETIGLPFSVTNMTGGADAGIIDGDYFTVKYSGSGTVPVEFDIGDGTTGGRIPLIFTGTETADDIRDAIITLLNTAAPTQLTASSGGAATVNIVLDTPGATGDTNTENVADAGFAVTGFADPTHATTVTYQLVACLADGSCTQAGADSTTGTATATLSASNFNRLSWTDVPGTALYKVYRKVAPTSPATTGIIYAGTALTLDDTGLAGGGETAPTTNGTGRITSGALTSGNIALVGTGGQVVDDTGLTWAGTGNSMVVRLGLDTYLSRGFGGNLQVGTGASGVNLYNGSITAGNFYGAWAGATALISEADGRVAFYSGATYDVGLSRLSAGTLGLGTGANGDTGGTLKLTAVHYVTGSRPTCDATTRGLTWYVAGGAGVADTIEICGKSAADTYAWAALATF